MLVLTVSLKNVFDDTEPPNRDSEAWPFVKFSTIKS